MATNSTTLSCGLKNSQCQQDVDLDSLDDPNDWIRRFTFVDQTRGLWSSTVSYPEMISCPVGGIVVFYYPQGWHDVVELPARNAYSRCNLADAIVRSPLQYHPDVSFPDISYYYHCSEPDSIAYLTCSVPGHCLAGQKIMIFTNGSEYAYEPPPFSSSNAANEKNWTLHVTSLNRLLRLLNWRIQDDLVIMDHGYQTEELANVTANLVWCAIDHCPLLDDGLSTIGECESILYTLLGFIHRKRPVSLWDVAEEYYRKAIELGGGNECTAQSYLSLLFWNQGNYSSALLETARLCTRCRVEDPRAIAQARAEWESLDISNELFDWDASCVDTSFFLSNQPTEGLASSSAIPTMPPNVPFSSRPTMHPSYSTFSSMPSVASNIPSKAPLTPQSSLSSNGTHSWIGIATMIGWLLFHV